MDVTRKLEPHFPAIEKVLIMLIFLSVFLNWFISDSGNVFSLGLVILQVFLIVFYSIQLLHKLYGLIWVGFLVSILSYFFPDTMDPFLEFFLTIGSYVAFGIIILIQTIKVSLKNKNFELLNFIMGFLLIFQLALPFIPMEDELITFYSFALTFSMGTIIYNDNLWHRYTPDEKNIIKYILIVFLITVLKSSFKYLNV